MIKNNQLLSEDWTVVFLGFFLIIIALIGILIPTPSFGWETTTELTEKVLSGKNLLKLVQVFGITYIIAMLSARLLGKSIMATAQGFPIVFVLTSLSLVMERYAFLIAQLFNVFVTLLVAYMLF